MEVRIARMSDYPLCEYTLYQQAWVKAGHKCRTYLDGFNQTIQVGALGNLERRIPRMVEGFFTSIKSQEEGK
jgi:hypothetical protein